MGHQLAGRVALIIGGGGEIGGATARRFGEEGASVVVVDFNHDAAAAVAHKITSTGGVAIALSCDVTNEESVKDTVDSAVRHFGKVTSLVNLAATVTPAGTLETLTLENWKRTLDVNLTGMFLTCKYVIPHMKQAGGGTIGNIASSHGHVGVPKRAPYCTSKAGVLQLTKIIAIDFGPDGIRANTISPGAIDTQRAALQRFPSREAANAAKGPSYLVNRTGQADEIAAGAMFLSSDESSFITGTDLLIDGGYSAFKGTLTHPA